MIENIQHLKIYKNIQNDISNALINLQDIQIKNKKGNAHVEKLKKQLSDIKTQFSDEICFLEKNSEWEKFTIAFFGETNAGKSTILEALRILFEEKSRQEKIKARKAKTEDYEKTFSEKFDLLTKELNEVFISYSNKTHLLSDEIQELSNFLRKQNSSPKNILKYGLISSGSFFLGLISYIFIPNVIDSIITYVTLLLARLG